MSKLRPLGELEDAADVFTCTWIEERSFKDGQFQDPYLGNLNAFYEREGLRTKTLTLPLFPRVLLKRVFQEDSIIPTIYFSRFADIFHSFYRTFAVNPTRMVNSTNGLDLASLFDDAYTAGKDVVFQSTLNYHCFLRFFKQPGLSFSALIYPFENQPWDKVMIKAMRDSGRTFKVVGYQHSTISPLLLNYFLGTGEEKIVSLPDAIIANGKHWTLVLKDGKYSCPIENGGSLRFSPSVRKADITTDADNARHKNGDNVLVLLSASLWYSLDLLYFLLSSAKTNKTYLIKPHPDISERIIRKNIPHFPDNFIFIEGSMDECMAKAGWAVHIGTTAAFECMMKGLTVFKYLPERIDLDPLLGLDIEQRTVTDHDELDFSHKAQTGEVDNSLIAEPFNEDVWKEILK
jgi:surface carbohydrate biosynthesis protein (TIGR04326 family)